MFVYLRLNNVDAGNSFLYYHIINQKVFVLKFNSRCIAYLSSIRLEYIHVPLQQNQPLFHFTCIVDYNKIVSDLTTAYFNDDIYGN